MCVYVYVCVCMHDFLCLCVCVCVFVCVCLCLRVSWLDYTSAGRGYVAACYGHLDRYMFRSILKYQLTTMLTILNDCRAIFWEFLHLCCCVLWPLRQVHVQITFSKFSSPPNWQYQTTVEPSFENFCVYVAACYGHLDRYTIFNMGWLWLVGSLKLRVSLCRISSLL